MPQPIALQLYSVRDALEQDFEGVVRAVADMGCVGVETAGFPGTNVHDAAALLRELGLEVCSMHNALPLGDDRQRVLDEMAELGCRRIVSGKGPEDFASVEAIHRTADQLNEASTVAVEHGLTLGLHNHWWEFERVEDRLPYSILIERLAPEVFFEIDTYWAQVAGADVARVIADWDERVRLLHLKDGPCVRERPMTALGAGRMDFPPIIQAAAHAEWLIIELDTCATDMLEAVRESIAYLTGAGLGRAR